MSRAAFILLLLSNFYFIGRTVTESSDRIKFERNYIKAMESLTSFRRTKGHGIDTAYVCKKKSF